MGGLGTGGGASSSLEGLESDVGGTGTFLTRLQAIGVAFSLFEGHLGKLSCESIDININTSLQFP
jgi:hypothetical protein